MSMYKDRDCFFIYSSFLAGKEAKEAGGTYEWFPLAPLSTFDGDAVPLDSPCSGGESGRFSSSRNGKGTARAKSKRGRKAEETTRGRELAECRNFGRKRKRLPAAHRRAGVVLGGVLGRVFVSHQIFWLEIGGRRC